MLQLLHAVTIYFIQNRAQYHTLCDVITYVVWCNNMQNKHLKVLVATHVTIITCCYHNYILIQNRAQYHTLWDVITYVVWCNNMQNKHLKVLVATCVTIITCCYHIWSRLTVVSREAKAEAASTPTALDSLHVSIYKNKCQETEESRNSENWKASALFFQSLNLLSSNYGYTKPWDGRVRRNPVPSKATFSLHARAFGLPKPS